MPRPRATGLSAATRALWGAILWWMRRPWMRRLQRSGLERLPGPLRERALASLRRQNRFALRWGRRIVHGSVLLVLASLAVQLAYAIVVDLALRGAFTVPEDLRPMP